MFAWEIESVVFDLEEVRVVIRAPSTAQLGRFNYTRKAAGSASVNEWLQQRVLPAAAGHEVVVVDGTGRIPHGRMKMETLRASYTA